MKKLILAIFLLFSANALATEIHNPDGSVSYVTEGIGGTVIHNPDGSNTYVGRDFSGATVLNNPDGTTTYITN